jgi:hypothetical protein
MTSKRPSKTEVRAAMRVLAAVGGSARSEKKTAANRANAKRPRPSRRKVHLYRPLLRPATFATLPAGVAWEYAEMPPSLAHRRPDVPMSTHVHGVIRTDRALTADECERFDLALETKR